AGNATAARLLAIEEDLYQTRNRSGQDPLNFAIKLNNRMAALGSSVEVGESRPTAAAYVVFDELSNEIDQQLDRLKTLASTDVASFNAVAARHGLAPVK
ncbi:MAG: hypothetical protein M3Z30_10805, partial [Gemmatimonadota bacterium]|nr:hypothetical protein [Gemmatimonadota bacterium]